jgi:hypothetical protein
MKLSNIIAAATRRLHVIAVQAHIKSLRLTVAAADAKVRVLDTEANIAASIATKAREASAFADKLADDAAVRAATVRLAAKSEAVAIGGVL